MTENSSPKSKFANFSPVPRRAFADRRMKARHLKVLGAICVAVDSPTGAALISQKRVAHHAGIARQKVGDVIADLKEFGYIAPIPRGRTQRGRFKTIVYRVLYEQAGASCSEPDDHHVTPGGVRGTTGSRYRCRAAQARCGHSVRRSSKRGEAAT